VIRCLTGALENKNRSLCASVFSFDGRSTNRDMQRRIATKRPKERLFLLIQSAKADVISN
jgi:hypothetical protein